MKYKQFIVAILSTILLFSAAASAQKAEMTINLNEAFFDGLLESIFQNYEPIEFPIALNSGAPGHGTAVGSDTVAFIPAGRRSGGRLEVARASCQSIRILREMNGVRTAVRFRNGKVVVPLAFSGSYAPPFVGCVEFAGIAEANIDLEFDQAGQRLIGRARVFNVNLNGTGGVGGSVIAKLVQSSLDKKLNPIELISLEKMSFTVPIRSAGSLRMRALSAHPEVNPGTVSVRIAYTFEKG